MSRDSTIELIYHLQKRVSVIYIFLLNTFRKIAHVKQGPEPLLRLSDTGWEINGKHNHLLYKFPCY
jgi:hypothetical protein